MLRPARLRTLAGAAVAALGAVRELSTVYSTLMSEGCTL
jgi:hypothetical protein